MSKGKIKIQIRNNHWKKGSLPCDLEGEKNSSVPKELFENFLNKHPKIKHKISYIVDWDDDNWKSSMKDADILLTWNFPTNNLIKIAPNLKWIHIVSAGVNHLYPFNWLKKDLILTNSSGIHSKKAGEFGLMSVLMLQNHMTRIITNQKKKEFVTLLSNPIDSKKVVVVGTGSLGGAMIKHISLLGAKVIGVNRRGRAVEGCSKVITFDKIDEMYATMLLAQSLTLNEDMQSSTWKNPNKDVVVNAMPISTEGECREFVTSVQVGKKLEQMRLSLIHI